MPSPKNNLVRLRAYAKLNISLKVLGKREDGFHDIDSLMESISLHDEVEVKPAASGIKVICTPKIESNIAEKAAKVLLDELKLVKGVEIIINKHIPVASGLAGGSADAAAVLIGMNAALGLNVHKTKLMEIGAKVGCDVPFCLVGGTARALGCGDKIEHENPTTRSSFILVLPKIQVSTKAAYEEFDKLGVGNGEGNDLEAAAIKLAPEIKKIKDQLIKATRDGWKMSGSGPALFLELSDFGEAEKYTEAVKKLGSEFHVVKRMDSGVEIIS